MKCHLVIAHSNDAINRWRQRFGKGELADGIDAAVTGHQRLNWCAEIAFAMIYRAETILLHRQLPFSLGALRGFFYRAVFRQQG